MAEEETTRDYTAIVRETSQEKWVEIFSASSRKAREVYLHRHGVRKPKNTNRLVRSGANKEARAVELYQVLQNTEDHKMCEEILRTWLLTKRDLLASTLEHFGIEHDNGLTDSDEVDKIAELAGEELATLCHVLTQSHAPEDVSIYLQFMGAENVQAALATIQGS